MIKVGQRFLAVLLCVCLVFSCMTVSASAFAAELILTTILNIGSVLGALSTIAGLYHVEPNVIMDSIRNTSITYIGQTAEYDKHYELYYELPDGRDSADLTASDLEQISTSFKDVMNYARSADDLSQRVLYHFDGNTQDSSYWSYCTDFYWKKGASLTYMDEGTFGGSLYLDETAHNFTITLPGSSDLSGDWTLQFRYYQSYTATPKFDSGIWVGATKLVAFSGTQWGIDVLGNATMPVGTWNELCFIRKNGVVYHYLNGVCRGSASLSSSGTKIEFLFGSEQQTYKKLDELRFTRGAIYTPGQNYEPTSVPYDSNLTLVLPDERIPVADEVLVFEPAAGNLFNSVGLADWSSSRPSSVSVMPYLGGANYYLINTNRFSLYYNPDYTSFSPGAGFTTMACSSNTVKTFVDGTDEYGDHIDYDNLNAGLFLPIHGFQYEEDRFCWWHWKMVDHNKQYTLTVVLDDGSYSTCTFTASGWNTHSYSLVINNSVISSPITFSAEMFGNYEESDDSYWWWARQGIVIRTPAGTPSNIRYVELIPGSSPGYTTRWEGAVYDPAELTESPVLAVRSNLPITTYQIGGVRPSYPQKGQVYAMVERGYITSLQQYTGSAWESVDGRIWTGSRWIPASSYNVITLQDMYDIVDATPDYEYIYSESGFWDWFQRAWKDLISRLDKIIDGQGKGSGAGSVTDEDLPPVLDNPETPTDEGWKAYDLLVVIKDGVWSFVTGVVKIGFDGIEGFADGFSYVSRFFDAYQSSNPISVLGITNYGGADIWD